MATHYKTETFFLGSKDREITVDYIEHVDNSCGTYSEVEIGEIINEDSKKVRDDISHLLDRMDNIFKNCDSYTPWLDTINESL